jgi:hypothetical protein
LSFTIGEYFLFHFTSNFSRGGVENLLFLYCTMMQQFFNFIIFKKFCFNILINISNFVLKSINKNLRSYLVYYKSLSNHHSSIYKLNHQTNFIFLYACTELYRTYIFNQKRKEKEKKTRFHLYSS